MLSDTQRWLSEKDKNMNLARKVINNIINNVKELGRNAILRWENTQGYQGYQGYSEYFGESFGISGYISRSSQRSSYINNGNFSRVINNVVDGVVSLPIRSENGEIEIDKVFLRSAIYDFILGSAWVEPTQAFGKMFENKPNEIKLKSVRDSEMTIIFDNNNEPLYYQKTTGATTEKIEISEKFDANSEEKQLFHIFQSNPYVSKQESYNGVGNAATEGLLLKASQNRDEAEANFLENKGVAGFVTNRSDYALNPKEEKEINDANKRKIGGASNFNRLHYINANIDVIKTSADVGDLKLLETHTSHLQKIASIFRLDSTLFGDKTKSIYNTVQAAKVGAYTDCYIPIFNEFIAPLNKYIGSDFKVFEDEIHVLEAAKVNSKTEKIKLLQSLALTELLPIEEARKLIKEIM